MTLTRKTKLIAAAAALPVVFGVAMAMAAPPSTNFANVSANTRSQRLRAGHDALGRAGPDRGRPGLDAGSRTRRRRCRTTATTTTSLNADGQPPLMVAAAATGNTRRTRPSPTRTSISSSTRPAGRRPGLRLRGRTSSSRATRRANAGLHHADQPRRRRSPSGDAARHAGLERRPRSRRSTARPGIRSPSGCCSRPRTRTRRPTRRRRTIRPRSTTSPARSAAAATKASRTTPTATSGSSRTSAARTRRATTAKDAEQLRLPLRAREARRPRATASCRSSRC